MVRRGALEMIIKIFKISTLEMCIIKHKNGLIQYIFDETGIKLPNTFTVDRLMKYLPVEEYYRVK